MKKSDVMKFMDKAMRRRVFRRTLRAIKTRNLNLDPQDLQSVVDKAVREVRAEHGDRKMADKS